MSWFTAHLVMYVKLKDQSQKRFPAWENMVLLKADSEDEAFEKAERRGREDEGDDDGSFRWGGQPATWVFAGVRKLTSCQDAEKRPGDGTEVSFLEMEFGSQEALEQFVAGESVTVRFREKVSTANES
jgi:Domain of unknown function (DUF4288)